MKPIHCAYCGQQPAVELNDDPPGPEIVILQCPDPETRYPCKAFGEDLRQAIQCWNDLQAIAKRRITCSVSESVRGG